MAIKRVDKPLGRPGKRLGSMVEKGSRRKETGPIANFRWWELEDEQAPGTLMALIQQIRKQQISFEQQRQVCARLYGGLLPGSFFGATMDRMHMLHPSLSGRLTYNIIAIVCDTLISRITKSSVRPLFLTQGGDYRQQRRAKKLSQFADGMAYETHMDDKGPDAFRDALVLSDGIVHVYEDRMRKRVMTERVIPSELYVDEIDGFYGTPTQMTRVKATDREQLLEAWKGDKKAVEMLKGCKMTALDGMGGEMNGISDTIPIAESWRLPSGVDDNGEAVGDGQHILWCEKGILTSKDERVYRKTRFPFSVFRWKPAIYGWHGVSLASELIGSQVEMNHLLIMFQRAFRLMAAFRIYLEHGTVPDSHFQDKIGTILHGPKGSQPPVFLSPPAMNDQYFRHFDKIQQRAFEIARLSQASAVGERPAGLDSGEAQRVYHDIETEGFQYVAKQYEQWHLDVTSLQIDTVRDIFEREKTYELKAPVSSQTLPGQRFLRTIDWKQVKMDEDEYVLKCYPTSSLPSTPQGKLATVQDLMRAGLIDSQTARKLLDYPDLSQVQSLLGAAEDWIMSTLDSIVEDGKYVPPDPWMNLQMAETLGLQEFSLGSANKMEPEKLDYLRRWITQVRDYKEAAAKFAAAQAQAAAPQAPAGPAGALPPGQGVPAPAPVSQLLPPSGTTPLAASA